MLASVRVTRATTADAAATVVVLSGMIILVTATSLTARASLTQLLRDPRRARVVNAALTAGLVLATAAAFLH